MEFLRHWASQVAAHLRGMSASQKLAIGLCVALMAVSLGWLVHWAGAPARVPLLDQPFTQQELAAVEAQLRASGADYEIVGDRVLVKPDDRPRLLASLQQSSALPSDTSLGFAKLLAEENVWRSKDDNRRRWNLALSNELSQVLRQFNGVSDAQVFIDKPVSHGLGRDARVPQASVYMKIQPQTEVSKRFVEAVASLISGAVSGLTPQRVQVVDATTGRRYAVPDRDGGMVEDMLDLRRQKEQHYTRKILSLLDYIPGVLVGVTAELVTKAERVESRKLDKPTVVEEESTSATSKDGASEEEPGVVPNVGRAVAAGGVGRSTEESTERTRFTAGETRTSTQILPGTIKRLTASVNVPRSYFAAIYRQARPDQDAPSDDELRPIITAQLEEINKQVAPLVDVAGGGQVHVGWFYDSATVAMAPGAGEVPRAEFDVMGLAGSYWQPAALGLLAMISLLMIRRMVRKAPLVVPGTVEAGGGAAAGASTRKGTDEEVLLVGAAPVGRAEVTEGVLTAQELDDNDLRSQTIAEQVAQLVQSDPAAAAKVVQRWVGHEK